MPPIGLGNRRRARGSNLPPGVLFDYDASTATAGAVVLTGTGLTVERTATATVQSSASTIITGIPANTGRIFYDGAARGLLVEEARTQYEAYAQNLKTATGSWFVAAGSTIVDTATVGPDGATIVQRLQSPSGGYAYQTVAALPTGAQYVASAWVRESATPGGLYNFSLRPNNSTTNVVVSAGTAPAVWTRKSVTTTHTTGVAYTHFAVGFDDTTAGGQAAGARDFLATCVQVEPGSYATSFIPNAGTAAVTRDQDILYHTGFASLLHAGRLSLYFKLAMRCASTQISNYMTLFDNNTNANSFAVTSGSGLRYVYLDGGYTGSLPTWAAGDILEIYVAMGGGSVASRWVCQKNGAGVSASGTGSIKAAIAATDTRTNLLCQPGQTRTFPAALMRFTAYDSTTLPGAWAA